MIGVSRPMKKTDNRTLWLLFLLLIGCSIPIFPYSQTHAQMGEPARARSIQNLIEAMGHEDWEIREKAVSVAASFRDPLIVKPMIDTALNDPNPYVKDRAIWALGAIGDQRAVEPLVSILKDDDVSIRQRAVEALAKIGGPETFEILTRLVLHDESPIIRHFALDELLSEKNSQLVSLLASELGNESSKIRENAALALAATKEPEAIDALATLATQDRDPAIRRLAASSLGEFRSGRAMPPLILALEDESPDVRKSAVESLMQLNDRRAVVPILKLLYDENQGVRDSAIQALGILNDPKATPDLIHVLDTGGQRDRANAVRSLASIDDPRAVDHLVKCALNEKDYTLRQLAFAAVARGRGGYGVKEKLIDVLYRDDSFGRENAIELLERINAPEALEPLASIAVKDAEPKIRYKATLALGSIDATKAAGLLEDSLKDQELFTRINAVEALEKIRSVKSVDVLIKALKNDENTIRARSASVLGAIGGMRSVRPLIESLRDPDLEVRKHAANALVSLTGQNFGQDIEQWEKWRTSVLKKADY